MIKYPLGAAPSQKIPVPGVDIPIRSGYDQSIIILSLNGLLLTPAPTG
jgi:hypothetical protein